MTTLVLIASMSFSLQAHNNDKKEMQVVTKTLTIDTETKIMTKDLVSGSEPSLSIRQFHHALKTGDRAKARALLADDVTIFEGGRVERSADEYAQHHMLDDMKYLASINTEVLEQQIKVIGDLAYSSSKTKLTGQYQGKVIDHEGMETMVLIKAAGNWKIIHIHWSN